ncbi:MAG: tRNA (adenosine(37)-N6)-threonylcarbamoyltransferase complex dimerization subunit type 1 TsaB [Aaplasma endosymbiont of Hyalomma asiaticum]
MILNTAGSECIGGILDADADVFFERRCSEKNSHSESLFSVIDAVLLDAKLTFQNISNLAVIVGPGSYTGLRAALSAAQGLEMASRVSVHAITFLELHAYLISRSFDENDVRNVVSVVETQKEHIVYHQVFSSKLVPITSISVESRDSIMLKNEEQSVESVFSLSKNTKLIGEYLVYKLFHKLPETQLLPIYSRFYN